VYDILGNNPIHYAVPSNAGTAIRFLGQRGIIIFGILLIQINFLFLGCNPKAKNSGGITPKQIADECNAKDAKKNIAPAENGYYEMNGQLRLSKLVLLSDLYFDF
jgi:ankyrin repeat protein